MSDVILKSIFLSKDYGEQATYSGSVSFGASTGSIELKLSGELSRKIVAVCAEELVAAAKETADALNESMVAAIAGPALTHEVESDAD